VAEPALQPVHVTIKQFGVTDGTEQHVDLTVAADRTLGELFAAIAPEHRSARGLTWRFQIGERVLDWAVLITTLRTEYANTRNYPDGVLWLDLLFFAERAIGNDFVLRTAGSTPGYASRSSESNLPTLPDVALPDAPGVAPGGMPPPTPPAPAKSAAPPPRGGARIAPPPAPRSAGRSPAPAAPAPQVPPPAVPSADWGTDASDFGDPPPTKAKYKSRAPAPAGAQKAPLAERRADRAVLHPHEPGPYVPSARHSVRGTDSGGREGERETGRERGV